MDSRAIPRAAWLALVLAVSPASGAGSSAPPWTLLESTAGRTVVRLHPAAELRLEPVPDPRYRRPELDGFGSLSVEGAPALPQWIGRVAIPEGAETSLRVLSAAWEVVPGVRPAPAATRDVLYRPEDGRPAESGTDVRLWLREDPAVYAGDRAFPESPVRLGPTGQLRRQPFVELIYFPLAFDPARQSLLRCTDLVVEITHRAAAPRRAGAPAPEEDWESIYRGSLINYAAGRQMRRTGPALAPGGAGLESAEMGPPVWKIAVSADGLYRIDHAALSGAAPALLGTDPRTWHLSLRGVEQPIRILGESDGTFDPSDILEFYGTARAEPDMALEQDLSPLPSVYRETDVGGAHVYLLTASGAPGSGARVGTLPAAPDAVTPLPPEPDFEQVTRFEMETVFLPLGGDDAWYWGPRTNSLQTSGGASPAVRTLGLALPGLLAPPGDGRLRVALRGTTSLAAVPDDHVAQFQLNGSPLPDLTFDGETLALLDVPVAHSALADPSSLQITAAPVFDGGNQVVNEFILAWAEVTHRRDFDAAGSPLRFQFPDGDFGFTITGLPDADVLVYEVTGTVGGSVVPDPVLLTGVAVSGSGPYSASFEIHPTGAGTRSFLVTTGGLTGLADSMVEDTPSDLANPANGAGYLIITHPDLIDTTPGSSFDQFVAARQAEGLPVAVAFVEDIFDEFADSLPGPQGLRDFLAHVFSSWAGWDADGDTFADPPRYVLFLGDGTVDFRQRFTYGSNQPFFDRVPTAIFYVQQSFVTWFSSDNWIASVAGSDRMPDFLLGRLSTRSAQETEDVLAKILSYESAPPAGAWRSDSLFLADKGNSQIETDQFEGIAGALESAYVVPPYTSDHLYYFSDFGGSNAAAMNAAILAGIDDGVSMLNYIGHGAFTIWGTNSVFLASDIPLLSNGGMLPFVVVENCLSGGFSWHIQPAMGEALTQTAGRGAIAVFAPAGLSSNVFSQPVGDAVWKAVMGPEKERRVGAATARGLSELASVGNTVELLGYQLSGDPATRLALPAPPAPSDLAAAAGNTVVHLSWTASSGGVAGYHLYRSFNPSQGYTRITGGTPVAGTTYDDTAVQNTKTYFYAAVAVDAQGFESAWSNRNTDCPDGQDCVWATPTNPFPPSQPTGIGASNPGTGDRIRVGWNANPEPDIKTYRVHWRPTAQPPPYAGFVEAPGTSTEFDVVGLVAGTEYAFAVEAENFNGFVSPLSVEAAGTPTFIEGIRPPANVGGLAVVVAAADATSLDLSWGAVTENIYGEPATVVSYEIYRGATPGFLPSLGSPQAAVPAPTLSWRDLGAASAPGDLYYLVAAVDGDGQRSGIGADLPMGVGDLTVTLQGDGQTVDLSWSPVTTTVSGGPAIVTGYQVHGDALPVPREGAGPGTLLATVGGTAASHLPPAGKIYYYTVLVLDYRGALSPY